MRDRWQQVAFLAGGLFIINVVIRFGIWLTARDNAGVQTTAGWAALLAPAVLLAVVAAWWSRRAALARVLIDVAAAAVVGCLASVLIGPFAGGSVPFAEGARFFFGQIWIFFGLATIGTLFGIMVMVALGLDYRSQALKRYAELQRSKPRRVVRR